MGDDMKPFATPARRGPLTTGFNPASQRGVMLLEALIAILIFSLGILAVAALQATAIRSVDDSKFRNDASFLASETIGQIWVDIAHIANYAGTVQPATDTTPAADTVLPGGTRTIVVAGDAVNGYSVTVTIQWKTPGEDATPHTYVTSTMMHLR